MVLHIFRPGKTWSSLHSYAVIEKLKSILISDYRKGVENLNRQRTANALISLHRCAFWYVPFSAAYGITTISS